MNEIDELRTLLAAARIERDRALNQRDDQRQINVGLKEQVERLNRDLFDSGATTDAWALEVCTLQLEIERLQSELADTKERLLNAEMDCAAYKAANDANLAKLKVITAERINENKNNDSA